MGGRSTPPVSSRGRWQATSATFMLTCDILMIHNHDRSNLAFFGLRLPWSKCSLGARANVRCADNRHRHNVAKSSVNDCVRVPLSLVTKILYRSRPKNDMYTHRVYIYILYTHRSLARTLVHISMACADVRGISTRRSHFQYKGRLFSSPNHLRWGMCGADLLYLAV